MPAGAPGSRRSSQYQVAVSAPPEAPSGSRAQSIANQAPALAFQRRGPPGHDRYRHEPLGSAFRRCGCSRSASPASSDRDPVPGGPPRTRSAASLSREQADRGPGLRQPGTHGIAAARRTGVFRLAARRDAGRGGDRRRSLARHRGGRSPARTPDRAICNRRASGSGRIDTARRRNPDRDIGLAGGGPPGPYPRLADGTGRRVRDHQLRAASRAGPRRRGRASGSRPHARRPCRPDAAHVRRIPPRLHRHSLCRMHPGSDLSARASVAARRSSAPSGRDPRECRGRTADHGARGPRAGAFPALDGREHAIDRDRGQPGGRRRFGTGSDPHCGRRCPSSIHLRQHGGSQGRGAQPCQPARQYPRHGPGHGRRARPRRLRQLAAALPRHGTDRRVARQPLLRGSGVDHVAAGVPGPAGELAVGDPCAPGNPVGSAELRL